MLARLRTQALRLLRATPVAFATLAAIVYVLLAANHLRYPFELEWMEGGLVDAVRHLVAGGKLYVAPTLDYTPYLYGPLYFQVSAVFMRILGAGFLPLRLVSFLASLGCIALIGRTVHRETGSRAAAVLAGGLYAATYREASAFFDIARVDSLFVLLVLATFYVVRFRASLASRALAAALLTLAFLTKQSAALLLAPLALHVALIDRRRAIVFIALAAALMLGSALALNRYYGGWFYYFVLWLPRQHPIVWRMLHDFWLEDLMAPLTIALLFGLLYLFIPPTTAPAASPSTIPAPGSLAARRFHLLAALGTLAVSWLGRLHAGGWPNVIMPGFASIAILFGLGVHTARTLVTTAPAPRRAAIESLIHLVAAIQFLALAYDPRALVPTRRDLQAGNELLAQLRAIDGDVFMPAHGFLATLAGKRTFAQEMAMQDILGIGGGPPGDRLRAEILRAIKEKRFAAVVADTDWFRREIEVSYRRKSDPFSTKDGFYPVTGMRTRPRTIYLPKTNGAQP